MIRRYRQVGSSPGSLVSSFGLQLYEARDGELILFYSAQAEVRKFLMASGHDLCHENRRELAEAFGLTDVLPKPPENRHEFRERCHEYEDQIYGRET